MGLTWYVVLDVLVIVALIISIVWLLRYRAASRDVQRLLEDRLRFETLLSEVFAKLVHVDASQLDAALEAALRQMVRFLGADRGNLDEYVGGAPGTRVSWAESGIDELPPILMVDQLVWTADTLRRGDVVRFSRGDELPEAAAADRAWYERLGTRSHLSIPLQAGGPMLGVLSFDAVRNQRAWPDDVVGRLRLLSEAFAGALERKRMELSLAERLRFQRLLSHLSGRFSNVSPLDFDREVDGALRWIVDFLDVHSAALIEFAGRGGGPGRSWTINQVVDADRFPWLLLRLRDGHVVHVSRVSELPDEAAVDRRTCLMLGVTSLAALPLRAGGAAIGGLVLMTGATEREWSPELIEQLHLLVEVLANALAGANAEREAGRLRHELTHIGRVSAMGELTASLAHELNQPLTAILNNAEAAQHFLEVEKFGELGEILSDIVADDKRAAAVIHRLRTLLKKGDLEYLPLNINDVVNEVAQLVKNDMVVRNVPMTLDLSRDLPNVRGDRVQLQQVVLNMVLNGLEAMGRPNGREHALVIRTSRASAQTVTVSIQDSGTGIDLDDFERMVQPLYTTKAEGLGMGLAIARSIVDAHGGHLRASNNPGGGATFEFTLPIDVEGP